MNPLRVVVLDGLSIVPYYTGHLCASLNSTEGVRVWSACITYHHDPAFFNRMGVRNDPGLLDFAWRAPAQVRRLFKGLEYLVNLVALLVRFACRRPAVIHVQFLPLLARGIPVEEWFLRIARILGIRLVYTVHNLLPQDSGDRWRNTFAGIYRLADRLICHDHEAAARLVAEFAVPRHRIAVIPHGPLFEQQRATPPGTARARLGFPPRSCVFLWQGILRPYKGVSFLLKAWQQFCAAESDAILAIVGGGDRVLADEIERETASLGIGRRVRLDLRFVSLDELNDYFEAADVLVYPYSEITTSGALMTGIVHAKALIATSLPAFERLLADEQTALLTPYGDVDALAGKLLRLAGDPDLRMRLRNNLQAGQSGFPRWPAIALSTRGCYLEALDCAGLIHTERQLLDH